MKLIIITPPLFFKEEAQAITDLFDVGLEILHLRKPGASVKELEQLLAQLPKEYLGRIVTHEHPALATAWGLKGIHLNRRYPQVPQGYEGAISCSCHSLEEVMQRKPSCEYLFLSPIYDSISKEGYGSGYSLPTLQSAHHAGIIDAQVMALGGICLENLAEVASLGFGGAVLLGDVWKHTGPELMLHFQELQRSIHAKTR